MDEIKLMKDRGFTIDEVAAWVIAQRGFASLCMEIEDAAEDEWFAALDNRLAELVFA